MTKLLFAKVLGGFSISSTCLFTGAGGYYLMMDEKKVIEMRKIVDEGRIIKDTKSKGTWTDMKVYSKSQLTLICTGNGPNGNPECQRYIKAKNVSKDKEQIFLHIGHPSQVTYMAAIYEFKYEGDQTVYEGQCDQDSVPLEDKSNPCHKDNLPKGWTVKKLMEIMELIQLLNPQD